MGCLFFFRAGLFGERTHPSLGDDSFPWFNFCWRVVTVARPVRCRCRCCFFFSTKGLFPVTRKWQARNVAVKKVKNRQNEKRMICFLRFSTRGNGRPGVRDCQQHFMAVADYLKWISPSGEGGEGFWFTGFGCKFQKNWLAKNIAMVCSTLSPHKLSWIPPKVIEFGLKKSIFTSIVKRVFAGDQRLVFKKLPAWTFLLIKFFGGLCSPPPQQHSIFETKSCPSPGDYQSFDWSICPICCLQVREIFSVNCSIVFFVFFTKRVVQRSFAHVSQVYFWSWTLHWPNFLSL